MIPINLIHIFNDLCKVFYINITSYQSQKRVSQFINLLKNWYSLYQKKVTNDQHNFTILFISMSNLSYVAKRLQNFCGRIEV